MAGVYLPPRLSLALFLARKGSGYRTCHCAPFSSSSCRVPLSSLTSICPDGSQWGDPTVLAPATAHTRSGTILQSHTLVHSADAVGKETMLVFQ